MKLDALSSWTALVAIVLVLWALSRLKATGGALGLAVAVVLGGTVLVLATGPVGRQIYGAYAHGLEGLYGWAQGEQAR